MDDAALAMASFARKVKGEAGMFRIRIIFAGERHTHFDQPLNRCAAVLHREAHRFFIAQAGAGIEGVLHVSFHAVGVCKHGGDPALGPRCGAVAEPALADDRDAQRGGQRQRKAQARGSATDYQNIVLPLLTHSKVIRMPKVMSRESPSTAPFAPVVHIPLVYPRG
ncbi:hypothetical protein AO269_27915 [Pseudomonas putida]|nr:hypothetical protein AO269_27915 [Pseudomonas putida]